MKFCPPLSTVHFTYANKYFSKALFTNVLKAPPFKFSLLSSILNFSYIKSFKIELTNFIILNIKYNSSILKTKATNAIKLGTEFISVAPFFKRKLKYSFNAAVSYCQTKINFTVDNQISKKLLYPITLYVGFQTLNSIS